MGFLRLKNNHFKRIFCSIIWWFACRHVPKGSRGKRTEWPVLQLTIASLFWQLEILTVSPSTGIHQLPLSCCLNSQFVFLWIHPQNHPARSQTKSVLYWLVVSTILKNISQWEGLSHILWKIKFMFETTNQYISNHSPRQLRPKEPVDSSLLIRRIANSLQRFPNFRLVKAQVGQILRTF